MQPNEMIRLTSRTAPLALLVLLACVLAVMGCAGLTVDDVFGPASGPSAGSGPLSQDTIIAGLKEALRVGSDRTVERTSVVDGFLANELIRIVLPEDLQTMAAALRRIGLERQVDRLEVAMNRAAEQAAGEAREILWAQVRSLTFPDALGILRGGDTAATEFLRSRTSDEIRARFRPIVSAKIEEVGLARLYDDLSGRYNQLPFVTRPATNLDDYVTEEALDGLFVVLGQEERKIRENPVARTTELLRRVFG